RHPHKAFGKYLLSGGMLICPNCGGRFEGRQNPWRERDANVDHGKVRGYRSSWLAQPKLTNLIVWRARLRASHYGGAAFAWIRERRLASVTGNAPFHDPWRLRGSHR